MYSEIDRLLFSLSKSKFRSSFKLNKKMIEYVNEKGMDKIKKDCYELIEKRIGPEVIPNDGKQTPTRQVHPVFIAQHATGCCCRGCLNKIHHISMNKKLNENELNYIVKVIMRWIEKEVENAKNR